MKYKLRFRKFLNPSKFDTDLLIYFEDNNGDKYVISDIKLEKYSKAGIIPEIKLDINTSDEELKRASAELYREDTSDAAYLRGALEATHLHLLDLQKIVFKEKK